MSSYGSASRVPPAAPVPRTLLLLGVIGAAVSIAARGLGFLPLDPDLTWPFDVLYNVADLCLALGMIGVFRATRRGLALVAAVVLFVGVPLALLQTALVQAIRSTGGYSSFEGLLDLFFYSGWLLGLTSGVLLGLVVLRAAVARWKQLPTALLFFVGVLLSAINLGITALTFKLHVLSPELYKGIVPVVSNVGGVISLVKLVGLALCLLELRRPAKAG